MSLAALLILPYDALNGIARIFASSSLHQKEHPALLLSVLSIAVATATCILVVLLLPTAPLKAFERPMLAVTVGFMLGDVFLHLIPESFTSDAAAAGGSAHSVGYFLIAGVLLAALVERATTESEHDHDHHHDHHTKSDRRGMKAKDCDSQVTRLRTFRELLLTPQARAYASQKACHCLAEGMTLYLSFLTSFQGGISASVALLLHEVPHKIADYTFLRASGFRPTEITRLQVFGCAGAIFGASACAFLFDSTWMPLSSVEPALLSALAAGGLLHMVFSTALPHLLEGGKGLDVFVRLSLVGIGARLSDCVEH